METKANNYRNCFFAVLASAAAVLLDQYTKMLAVVHLKDQTSIEVIEGVFQLHYLENRGAAFGMLQNQRMLFLICGGVILCLAAYLYIKMPHNRHFLPMRICIIGIVSGALGNMIDRIRLNYVIDFFYIEWIDFPVFNVADIYVTVSVFCLILLLLFYYKEEDMEQLFRLFSLKHTKKRETGTI